MTAPKFENAKAAKAAGWFSKRHENRDAHDQARASYQNRASTVLLRSGMTQLDHGAMMATGVKQKAFLKGCQTNQPKPLFTVCVTNGSHDTSRTNESQGGEIEAAAEDFLAESPLLRHRPRIASGNDGPDI